MISIPFLRERSGSLDALKESFNDLSNAVMVIIISCSIVCNVFQRLLAICHSYSETGKLNHGDVIKAVSAADRLDVYKRQVLLFAAVAAAEGISEYCRIRLKESSGKRIPPAFWCLPVSYTHLDVYKRQMWERSLERALSAEFSVIRWRLC